MNIKNLLAMLALTVAFGCTQKVDKNPFLSEYNTPYQVPPFNEIKTNTTYLHMKPVFKNTNLKLNKLLRILKNLLLQIQLKHWNLLVRLYKKYELF